MKPLNHLLSRADPSIQKRLIDELNNYFVLKSGLVEQQVEESMHRPLDTTTLVLLAKIMQELLVVKD